ncbi:MAG: SGNH/GDSL hydrolase family protein [Sulfuritalea sp.]|nr:SGNH/GDSL hydrolase family protein [Sulfuritalea sp.]
MGTIKTDEIDVGAIPLAGTIGGDEQILVIEESQIKRKQINQSGIVTATTDAVTGAVTAVLVDGKTLSIGNGVNVTNLAGLQRWRAAASVAEYFPARVNCLGDSITYGSFSNASSAPDAVVIGTICVDATAAVQGYVGRLSAMMARKYGTNPAGFIGANDSRNTLVGTGAASASLGPLINVVRVEGTPVVGCGLPLPAAATISIPVPACTDIEIIYLDSSTNSAAGGVGANTGTFSYAVDGGGATTTSADNVNPVNFKRIAITGLSNATHTLLLTGVSATCYIYGIFYHSGKGAIVSRFGLSSGTSLDVFGKGPGASVLPTGTQHRIVGSMGPSATPVSITGAVTSGSPVVTGIASTAGLVAGMPVGASAQLALPCFVESVDSASQITLTTAATGNNAGRTMFVGAGSTITADLWIVALGHNDWQQQNHGTAPTPVSVFTTQMQALIDRVVATGACVLLVGEPKSNNPAPTPETYTDADYWAALESLALANDHVACMQVNQTWGAFADSSALGLTTTATGVHPTKRGAADMAALVYAALSYSAAPAG